MRNLYCWIHCQKLVGTSCFFRWIHHILVNLDPYIQNSLFSLQPWTFFTSDTMHGFMIWGLFYLNFYKCFYLHTLLTFIVSFVLLICFCWLSQWIRLCNNFIARLSPFICYFPVKLLNAKYEIQQKSGNLKNELQKSDALNAKAFSVYALGFGLKQQNLNVWYRMVQLWTQIYTTVLCFDTCWKSHNVHILNLDSQCCGLGFKPNSWQYVGIHLKWPRVLKWIFNFELWHKV